MARALAPARRIEAAIRALEDDSQPLTLPRFALREFDRIAQTLNTLSAKLHAARQRQRQLSRRLLAVREQEQTELARELHDELGQSLEAIGVMRRLFAAPRPQRARSTLQRQCVRDIQQRNPAHSSPYPRPAQRAAPAWPGRPVAGQALEELTRQWQAPARSATGRPLANHAAAARPPRLAAIPRRAGVPDQYRPPQPGHAPCNCAREVTGRLLVWVSDNGVARVVPKYGCGLLGMRETGECRRRRDVGAEPRRRAVREFARAAGGVELAAHQPQPPGFIANKTPGVVVTLPYCSTVCGPHA